MVSTRRTPTKPNCSLVKTKAVRTRSRHCDDEDGDKERELGDVVSDSEEERERKERKDLLTPTRKRRKMSSSSDSVSYSSVVQVLVTPVKQHQRPSSPSLSHLPTPPITPTISLSSSPTCSSSSGNIYARARSLLRLSAHGNTTEVSELVGRNVERQQLDIFLQCNLPNLYQDEQEAQSRKTNISKALYVSGSPGTGKTALLQNVLKSLKARSSPKIKTVFLNCTTIHRPNDIWERLTFELGLESRKNGKNACEGSAFETLMTSPHSETKYLVVLDEIDHLLNGSSGISNLLTSLFSLALQPSSHLVLIGIANALDLTERHLAVLSHASGDCQSDLLHFRPFQPDEMVEIVKARLCTLHRQPPEKRDDTSSLPVIMPAALELAAKKVAGVTGDLRSFLSLIRKAVEIFEGEQKKRSDVISTSPVSPTSSKANVGALSAKIAAHADPLAELDALTAPRLTPAHILKATRLVSLTSSASSSDCRASNLGSSLSTSAQSSAALLESKVSELNIQQRLALMSFAIGIQQRSAALGPWASTCRNISPGNTDSLKPNELHAIYRCLLEKEDLLRPVGSNEFSDLLSGLHTRGLLGYEREYVISPGKSSKKSANTQHHSSSEKQSPTLLAPPMSRRTSSSSSCSSTSSALKSRSRSSSPSAAQAPLVLLYSLSELSTAIRIAKPAEAANICSSIMTREDKKMRRMRLAMDKSRVDKQERMNAPREGFHGDGLEDLDIDLMGDRDKTSRHDSEEEDHDNNTYNRGKGDIERHARLEVDEEAMHY